MMSSLLAWSFLALTLNLASAAPAQMASCKRGDKSACFQALRQIENGGGGSAADRTAVLDELCKLNDTASCQSLFDYYSGDGDDAAKAKTYESRLRGLGIVPSVPSNKTGSNQKGVEGGSRHAESNGGRRATTKAVDDDDDNDGGSNGRMGKGGNGKGKGEGGGGKGAAIANFSGVCRRPAKRGTPYTLEYFAPSEVDGSKCVGPCPEFSYAVAAQAMPASNVTVHEVNFEQATGFVTINVGNLTSTTTLVLSSKDRVQWQLKGAPNSLAQIRRIYLNGHKDSSVSGQAAGVSVQHGQTKAPIVASPLADEYYPFAAELRKAVGGIETTYQGGTTPPKSGQISVPPFASVTDAQLRQKGYQDAQANGRLEHTSAVLRFLQRTRKYLGLMTVTNGTVQTYDAARGLTVGKDTFRPNIPVGGRMTGLTSDAVHKRFILVDDQSPSHFYLFNFESKNWGDIKSPSDHILTGLAYDPRADDFWSANEKQKKKGYKRFILVKYSSNFKGSGVVRAEGIPHNGVNYDIQLQFVDGLLVIWKNDHSAAWLLDPGCPGLEKLNAF